MKNYLVVGASSGIGRALAEALARLGHTLILVASDERDLKAVANDLMLKYSVGVEFLACEIKPGADWLQALSKKIYSLPTLDGIFLPLGAASVQDYVCSTPELIDQLIETNFSAQVKIVAQFLPMFLAKNSGVIVGFGSVSSARGRNFNVVYAAQKRALASYFESLRHATSKTKLRVQLYQLGYLNTNSNWGKKLLFHGADPAKLATHIVKNLDSDFGVTVYPKFWILLGLIVRFIPYRIFKRLEF